MQVVSISGNYLHMFNTGGLQFQYRQSTQTLLLSSLIHVLLSRYRVEIGIVPTAAPTNCTKPGCGGLIRDGVCSVHGAIRAEWDRAHDRGRGTAARRGYDHTWRKVRRMQLANEPLCYDCKKMGAITVGTEVHHILAKRNGGDDSLENLMTLCKTCHSKRTARGE